MKELLKNKAIIAIITAIILICSGYALTTIVTSLRLTVFFCFLIVLFPVFQYIFQGEKTLNLYTFIIIGIMIFIVAVLRLSEGTLITYALLGCFVVVAFGLTLIYPFKKVVNVFLCVMTGITIISLIGYFLLNNIFESGFLPTASNGNNIEFGIGIIFYYIGVIPDRNCGVFWEPGLFASFLTIAIIFEILFKDESVNPFRILLFSLAIFTTQSSAGYILWVLSMFLWAFKPIGRKISPKRAKFLIFVLGICLIVGYFALQLIISSTQLAERPVFKKLLAENLFSSLRMKAMARNLEMFFSSPLFGNSMTAVSPEDIEYFVDTATSTYVLRIFGVMGIIYTLIWIFGIFKLKNIDVISRCVLFIIAFFIINKEPHLFNLFTWILMFYMLKAASTTNKIDTINSLPLYRQNKYE